LVENSFKASWLSEEGKAHYLAQLDHYVAAKSAA